MTRLGAAAYPQVMSETEESERDSLYRAIIKVLDEGGRKRRVDKDELTLWQYRKSDQTNLFKAALANVQSGQSFRFIYHIHEILDYYGDGSATELITRESMECANRIIEATFRFPSDEGFLLPIAVREMIHYTLTSSDTELVASVIEDRLPESLEVLQGMIGEVSKNHASLQSGVL